ncbi:MAG: sigma-54 dependent transcriptional regulator [Myxococcota bacterium]
MAEATILVIDDNETMREGVAATVRRMGHRSLTAKSGGEGLGEFRRHHPDLVITDLKMEGQDGIAVLKEVRSADPDAVVMIMTGFGTVESAVEAMKLGAFDFIQKPFGPEVVRLKVESALQLRDARKKHEKLAATQAALSADLAAPYTGTDDATEPLLVGESTAMKELHALLLKVARSDATVHIHGESGTGKELVARTIHQKSARAAGPFISVHCGALTETLLESELFGHEKGAFTGAVKRKLGRFELADGGTLFLDEIGDISPSVQTKLLRVLQERTFERVGGETPVTVDVRVVSATHRNLQQLVAEGKFRQDLLYRLNVVPVTLPPLRDRPSDVAHLAQHFIHKRGKKTNPAVKGISPEAVTRLQAYRWPGNVRELENVIEQALVFSDGPDLQERDLPSFLRDAPLPLSPVAQPTTSGDALPDDGRTLDEILEGLERALIVRAFQRAGGVKTETARLLGIKTSALYYKLEKYKIDDSILAKT